MLHSGCTSKRGRGVEYYVTGGGTSRDPPSHPFLLLHTGAALNPPTDAHVSSLQYAAKTTNPSQYSYTLLTGIFYATADLSGEACCFGLDRDRVGSDGSDELQVFFGENNNTVSWTQRSC